MYDFNSNWSGYKLGPAGDMLPAAGVLETRWEDDGKGGERVYLSIWGEQKPTTEAVVHMSGREWNYEGYKRPRLRCTKTCCYKRQVQTVDG